MHFIFNNFYFSFIFYLDHFLRIIQTRNFYSFSVSFSTVSFLFYIISNMKNSHRHTLFNNWYSTVWNVWNMRNMFFRLCYVAFIWSESFTHFFTIYILYLIWSFGFYQNEFYLIFIFWFQDFKFTSTETHWSRLFAHDNLGSTSYSEPLSSINVL